MRLGSCRSRVPEDIHDAAGVLRVVYRDGRRGAIPEEMRPQVLSERRPRVFLDTVRDRTWIQCSDDVRNPKGTTDSRVLAVAPSEQYRSVVFEISIELGDKGSRYSGVDRPAALDLFGSEEQPIFLALAEE